MGRYPGLGLLLATTHAGFRADEPLGAQFARVFRRAAAVLGAMFACRGDSLFRGVGLTTRLDVFCSHCETRNPDGANYCLGCGAALHVGVVPAASARPSAVAASVADDVSATAAHTVNTLQGKQCPACGLYDPGISERCDCGYNFVAGQPNLTSSPLFAVSTHKFIVLSICTFGLYELYWCYQNWVRLRGPDERISPLGRALFAPLWGFLLFSRMQERIRREGVVAGWSAQGLAAAYLILQALWKLPDPWGLVSVLTFVPLIPVQQSAQRLNDRCAFTESRNTSYTTANVVTIVIGGTLFVFSIVGAMIGSK